MPNRLAHESSPYLLQHANNPVDWYPWGEAAFVKATQEDKLVLLSIGYSTCHWCHVMERESFENHEIAALMNGLFVSIKVDREERPDLDEIYMAVTQALNRGHGGWPMTVFLTPDKIPVFAGTYFPPDNRYGRPGFPYLLKQMAELWIKRRAELSAQGQSLITNLMREHMDKEPSGQDEVIKSSHALSVLSQALKADFDSHWGGFGGAPKFPPSRSLSALLLSYHRTHDAEALAIVEKTLRRMAEGGIFDHLGFGFARYSTDAEWLVPHFEKMLYDNAELVHVYLEAYQITRKPFYAEVARQTLDYILLEMTDVNGGFYSAQDADSEGVEGKFYVFTQAEIAAVLEPEAARWFCTYFNVTEEGNFEGKNILHTPAPLEEVAIGLGLAPEILSASIERSRAKLYAARKKRIPPLLDDKIIVAWNGLMLRAMSFAGLVLSEPRYRMAAEHAAGFLIQHLVREDGRLYRVYRGQPKGDGYLEDYTCLCGGLLDVYEAGGKNGFLVAAEALGDKLLQHFFESTTGYFYTTAAFHEALPIRPKDSHDGALPSPHAQAALSLLRLSRHCQRKDFAEAAAKALYAYGAQMERYPRAMASQIVALDFLDSVPIEMTVAGERKACESIWGLLGATYLPQRIIKHHDENQAPALTICRDLVCEPTLTELTAIKTALSRFQG